MPTKDNKSKSHLYKGKFGPFDAGLIKALVFDFKNTPLEGYAAQIATFFTEDMLKRFAYIPSQTARSELQKNITECLEFAKCLRDVKRGIVKGKGWRIESKDDLKTIYKKLEEAFLNKLDNATWVLDEFDNPKLENAFIDDWKQVFADFPWSESFEFEDKELDEDGNEVEYGSKHLSQTEIQYIIKDLERYCHIAKKLTIDIDRKIITRFLEYMLDAGVPHTREAYKELYKVLDNFGYISEEVKHSHISTTSKYSESNYIKSLVNTILKNKN